MDIYLFRKALYWPFSGYRHVALLPLFILASYWIGGEQAMIAVAAIVPATFIVISNILDGRIADRDAVDGATGLGWSGTRKTGWKRGC